MCGVQIHLEIWKLCALSASAAEFIWSPFSSRKKRHFMLFNRIKQCIFKLCFQSLGQWAGEDNAVTSHSLYSGKKYLSSSTASKFFWGKVMSCVGWSDNTESNVLTLCANLDNVVWFFFCGQPLMSANSQCRTVQYWKVLHCAISQ